MHLDRRSGLGAMHQLVPVSTWIGKYLDQMFLSSDQATHSSGLVVNKSWSVLGGKGREGDE